MAGLRYIFLSCHASTYVRIHSNPFTLCTNNIRTQSCYTQGPILDSEISVGEITLTPGNWEVFWYATLDTVQTDPINPQNATGQSVTTCPSASCSFLVVGK